MTLIFIEAQRDKCRSLYVPKDVCLRIDMCGYSYVQIVTCGCVAGDGGGLRHGGGGRRLLAREELVGPLVGRARLHQDGAQQEQPLRHRVQRLLPARVDRELHANYTFLHLY